MQRDLEYNNPQNTKNRMLHLISKIIEEVRTTQVEGRWSEHIGHI